MLELVRLSLTVGFVLCSLTAVIATSSIYACWDVNINFAKTTATSRTITTLQVVANPLLNPITSPVANTIFANLANLDAEFVRYVPWFPYPKVGVAELDPPSKGSSSWDFGEIEPQLRAFMDATFKQGHKVIPNFSTQPTWMFSPNDYSYFSSPNKVDWGYARGAAGKLENTTQLVADYYARLLSWLVKGSFTDEYGVVYRNLGDTYQLTHWEVFNEPEAEHSFSVELYTIYYDAVVKAVNQALYPHKLDFVGLALAYHNPSWFVYFLNASNHDPAALPITYASYHFYASCRSRTDPNTYTDFFSDADGFFTVAKEIATVRDTLSPSTKLSLDETGVILPDENSPNSPDFPRIYWNAAGAFYAYVFANLVPLGYEIIGESQLAGVPPIPEWGILDPQYPSVSMVNWTTGAGNARFWVLDLLIKHFSPGDLWVETTLPPPVVTPYFCADLTTSIGEVTLTCNDPLATISQIQFAAYGTPSGTCGAFLRSSCDASNVTAYVTKTCLGNNNCAILSYPTFGDPCYGTVKRFAIQATCTGNQGGTGSPAPGASVFVQGVIDGGSQARKVLVINKANSISCVNIPGASGGISYTVDFNTHDGPARKENISSNSIVLAPFAVSVIYLN